MKKIKLIFALTVVSILFSTSCSDQRTGIVDIKFTTDLTQTDLNKIQEDLKSQNIDLTYDLLEFDGSGHLKKISASIDYNDGYKGSFQSIELQPADSPGFYHDFSKN
jgi:hypothetical protein